jgi:hypothetical protein
VDSNSYPAKTPDSGCKNGSDSLIRGSEMKLRRVSMMIVTTRPAESADWNTAPRPVILSSLTVVAVVAEASRLSQFHSNFDGRGSGSDCQW